MTDPYGQPPQFGGPGYPAPAYGPGAGNPSVKNSDDALIALVAAIASWVICPVVPSIVALVYAGKATQAIAASGGALGGSSMVTAARLIAWIHLALLGVFVLVVLVFVVGVSMGAG